MSENNFENIPKSKLKFAENLNLSHDSKLDTKPIGFLHDAFRRFCKNKGSIVAAIIVIILIIFALIGPLFINSNYTDAYGVDTDLKFYQQLIPKAKIFEGTGFWDGTAKKEDINRATYYRYLGIQEETGHKVIVSEKKQEDGNYYTLRIDTYKTITGQKKTLMADEYAELIEWQNEHKMQVILPYVRYGDGYAEMTNDTGVWYVCDRKGMPKLDNKGNFVPAYYTYASAEGRRDDYPEDALRLPNDPYLNGDKEHGWSYAQRTGNETSGYNYVVRLNMYNYFVFKFGFEPSFVFGTENHGYDIFTRLASGARFSMLFAVAVSAVNLFIGALWGAVSGYYGGKVDLIMERITDILASLPTTVITVLMNLHLSAKVGIIPSLLFAFVLTGWIGMAGTTRMQFYRYKKQEYVMAARTLGARDGRLMFKHIFPNALGTLITSSVLVIPGVIFSETSLTYLGIINLDSPTRSSVGAMLSAGQGVMTSFPHMVLFPALFIALLMVSFNLFGNGLRDAFNPSLRGAEG